MFVHESFNVAGYSWSAFIQDSKLWSMIEKPRHAHLYNTWESVHAIRIGQKQDFCLPAAFHLPWDTVSLADDDSFWEMIKLTTGRPSILSLFPNLLLAPEDIPGEQLQGWSSIRCRFFREISSRHRYVDWPPYQRRLHKGLDTKNRVAY